MWSATIVGKNSTQGVLHVGVEYTNGTETFIEVMDATGGNLDGISIKIKSKLVSLNSNEVLIADLGDLKTKPLSVAIDEVPLDVTPVVTLQ